jgi:signal transduction histidine kinase
VRSIRARLLIGLLGSMLLVLLAGAVLIFFTIQDEAAELFDHQLEHTAYAFAAQPLQAIDASGDEDNPEADFVIQRWSPDGKLSFQSRPLPGLKRQQLRGFSDVELAGERWRVFCLQSAGHAVQVAQPLRVRNAVARETALHTLSLFSLLFPLAALLIYVTVGRGLQPLHRIAEDVRRRSHRDLAPIDPEPLPREVAPLAVSLNGLMARLDRVITTQKTFVADAAHELLTPITALQLQAQLLSRALDEQRRHEALTDLRAGLARTIHLARQLLTLARQDPDLEQEPMAPVDVTELARRVVLTQLPLAEVRSVALELTASQPVVVQGAADALATLLANLVDNAIKYAPAGGRINVVVEDNDGRASLIVEDSGPGVPPEERSRIFDRFYRRPGASALGSGLGLSIARDIATRHRASIEVLPSPELGGLRVRVSFDAAVFCQDRTKPAALAPHV